MTACLLDYIYCWYISCYQSNPVFYLCVSDLPRGWEQALTIDGTVYFIE